MGFICQVLIILCSSFMALSQSIVPHHSKEACDMKEAEMMKATQEKPFSIITCKFDHAKNKFLKIQTTGIDDLLVSVIREELVWTSEYTTTLESHLQVEEASYDPEDIVNLITFYGEAYKYGRATYHLNLPSVKLKFKAETKKSPALKAMAHYSWIRVKNTLNQIIDFANAFHKEHTLKELVNVKNRYRYQGIIAATTEEVLTGELVFSDDPEKKTYQLSCDGGLAHTIHREKAKETFPSPSCLP